MSLDLHLEFYLPAPPTEVMQLLTDPVLIDEWSGDNAVVEKREGGDFKMFGGWVSGKIIKVSDNELAYTWKPDNWAEGDSPSEVHFKLEADDEGTRITLMHTGFPDKEEMDSHEKGWTEYFFEPMEAYILDEEAAD